MAQIRPTETLIEGHWQDDEGQVKADQTCKRIEWLISTVLNKIGTCKDGWETLYRDPNDKRCWVLYYPQSELHGGGPPSLKVLSDDESKTKFNI